MKPTIRKNPPIAFILNAFPVLSETFIINEVIGLRARGLDIRTFSLFPPKAGGTNEDVKYLAKDTYYLVPMASVQALLAAHILFVFTSPRRYFRTLKFALQNRTKRNSLFKTMARLKSNNLSKQQRQDLLLHFVLAVLLAREMKQYDLSLINSHFADAAASFAMLTSRLLNVPFGMTMHAYDIFSPQFNMDKKLSEAKFIFTCTHFNKSFLAERFPELDLTKIKVVYHGIDLSRFRRKQKTKNETPLILSIGRMVRKKGFPVLIEACRILKERGVAFKCQIIGDGPERPKLEMAIKLKQLINEVELIGSVPPSETRKHYESADIFALANLVEEDGNRDGIPNVIAEAMAMELPVISTTVSAIPELVEHKRTGYLVSPVEPADFANAIDDLIGHPRRTRNYGVAGRKKVSEVFDSEQWLDVLHDLYLQIQ